MSDYTYVGEGNPLTFSSPYGRLSSQAIFAIRKEIVMLLPVLDCRTADIASTKTDFLRLFNEGHFFCKKGKEERHVLINPPARIGAFVFRTRNFTGMFGALEDINSVAPVFVRYTFSNTSLLEPDSPPLSGLVSDIETSLSAVLPDGRMSLHFGPVVFFEGGSPEAALEPFRTVLRALRGKIRHCSVELYAGGPTLEKMEDLAGRKIVFPFSGNFLPLMPDPFVSSVLGGMQDCAFETGIRLAAYGDYGLSAMDAFGFSRDQTIPYGELSRNDDYETLQLSGFRCLRHCAHCTHALPV